MCKVSLHKITAQSIQAQAGIITCKNIRGMHTVSGVSEVHASTTRDPHSPWAVIASRQAALAGGMLRCKEAHATISNCVKLHASTLHGTSAESILDFISQLGCPPVL
eukprot:gnl/TRDRNA2_/TRDRNA2_205750_c0_seq1.p1 gnl/TRDRNA2_/TRDRNA2_205750_c0~~gnl/TRDRNA2_/TRDRNA2_205750_c0_seq1.p1  ORF type:complete len:107 (-),score=6.65 gnl/TRDRNA2_/TRDRNA2_205750_c0_seq1:223-543(-)